MNIWHSRALEDAEHQAWCGRGRSCSPRWWLSPKRAPNRTADLCFLRVWSDMTLEWDKAGKLHSFDYIGGVHAARLWTMLWGARDKAHTLMGTGLCGRQECPTVYFREGASFSSQRRLPRGSEIWDRHFIEILNWQWESINPIKWKSIYGEKSGKTRSLKISRCVLGKCTFS